MAPVIAVSAYYVPQISRWPAGGPALPLEYVEGLRRAGAVPLLVPPGAMEADEVLGRVDGLLLSGGGDVDPARYGQAPHPTIDRVDPGRDDQEFDLLRSALDRGMPFLAVCRGLQLLNVAAGGTLVQHLPDLDGLITHAGGPGLPVPHDVRVEPGSTLGGICGPALTDVASLHHQAIDRLGDGLRPVAWAPDGVVEAVELTDPSAFAVAVQWHPEWTAAEDPAQQRILDAFVAAVSSAGR
jgi:putative glutamine amidotransferase